MKLLFAIWRKLQFVLCFRVLNAQKADPLRNYAYGGQIYLVDNIKG